MISRFFLSVSLHLIVNPPIEHTAQTRKRSRSASFLQEPSSYHHDIQNLTLRRSNLSLSHLNRHMMVFYCLSLFDWLLCLLLCLKLTSCQRPCLLRAGQSKCGARVEEWRVHSSQARLHFTSKHAPFLSLLPSQCKCLLFRSSWRL